MQDKEAGVHGAFLAILTGVFVSYRAVGALALALVLCAGFAGCITPSIPIPPPDPEQMTFDLELTTGNARFSYAPSGVYEGAVVYVFNRNRGTGVIDTARADGGVGPTLPFPTAAGDLVVVSFQRDTQTVSTCIAVRQGRQSAADLCR